MATPMRRYLWPVLRFLIVLKVGIVAFILVAATVLGVTWVGLVGIDILFGVVIDLMDAIGVI